MILHKYLDTNGVALLRESRLKMSPPSAFNDPFDGLVQFERIARKDTFDLMLAERVEKQISGGPPEIRAAAKRVLTGFLTPLFTADFSKSHKLSHDMQLGLGERYLVACMSETPTSVLMWSYYADQHKGFTVGFDPTVPPLERPPENTVLVGRCHPVTYVSRKRAWPGSALTPESEVELLRQALLVKSTDWAHEAEWRLIDHSDRVARDEERGLRYVELNEASVSEICFGCRASSELRQAVVEAVSRFETPPTLLNACIRHDSFGLERRVVTPEEASETWRPPDGPSPTFDDVEDITKEIGPALGEIVAYGMREAMKGVSAKKEPGDPDGEEDPPAAG